MWLMIDRALLLEEPYFRDLAASPIAAQAGLAGPAEGKFSTRRCGLGYGELNGFVRERSENKWVHFDSVVGRKAQFSLGAVSPVNNAYPVACLWVKARIVHLERCVI